MVQNPDTIRFQVQQTDNLAHGRPISGYPFHVYFNRNFWATLQDLSSALKSVCFKSFNVNLEHLRKPMFMGELI